MNLETPIGEMSYIGPAYQKKLKRLGIHTVRDLLFYFPSRYDDFSDVISIDHVRVGETVCVQGRVTAVDHTRTPRQWLDIVEIFIEDQSGTIRAAWFNQPYLEKTFKEDDIVCLAGKVSMGKDGVYLNNPAYEKIREGDPSTSLRAGENLTHTGRIVPVYATTKGVTPRWIRYILKPILTRFHGLVPETLPEDILQKHKFLPIGEALWQIHFPDSFESADAAKARFSFEELFVLQLAVLRERLKISQKKAPACPMDVELMKKFTNSLPFTLTDSQRQCSYQILKDLEKSLPMSRLLEGDVGSGKTVVATMAALSVVKNGHQAAFMAPTEILAKQHFISLKKLLKEFDMRIGFLTSSESFLDEEPIKKKDLLELLKNGAVDILLGTHALIQKDIDFKSLALVVLDEQHRFGVTQRAALTHSKNLVPHLLSMTATPIPRTLALTIYGDLDLSLIKEMPKDRKPVKTIIVDQEDRQKAYAFIEKEAQEGKGIFVICPRIEQNQKMKSGAWSDVKAVKDEYEKLANQVFPHLRITMLHGKMKTEEKTLIMRDFAAGQIDILVSTSVVEVGVDVPRATVMMIEGAERFGLAQLHQFRGRVGRSTMQSYCFLFTTSPDQVNRKRLKAMEKLNSGFELAQKDLEIRGPGALYGTQQWGIPDMAMQGLGNIFLVEKTRQAAKELLEKDVNLSEHLILKEAVKKFEKKIHFE